MSNSPSTLAVLLESLRADAVGPKVRSQIRSQIYFKSSLTALSHAMEDQAMASDDQPLIIATFQQERFYRQEAHRYERIATQSPQVYVMAAPEAEFVNSSGAYETVAFAPTDSLSQEWNLVVIGDRYASCLVCEERQVKPSATAQHVDPSRRFEGIWTFDRGFSIQAANFLLERILYYRPELREKVRIAQMNLAQNPENIAGLATPGPFAERLVTYLQAGQYKLLKAYRAIAEKERRESLVNSIATAVRQSLDPEAVFQMTVQELGEAMGACRCLIYPCRADDASVTLHHEYLGRNVTPLAGQTLALKNHRLFQEAVRQETPIYLEQVAYDPRLKRSELLRNWAEQADIKSWLIVPLLHQGELLGIVELHRCGGESCGEARPWSDTDLALVEAIAPQISVAFIQARAYADLADLNQQLEALEQTRYNLTAIVGHELRTPLATVKICLESLASEPDMSLEVRQVMLNTALGDAERLRQLVQDFLTLSRLEGGRVQLQTESISIQDCVSLALSNINARRAKTLLPDICNEISEDLPLVEGDGERLVEVLAKLLDNACKFTESEGKVTIRAQSFDPKMLEVTIADNGRGIDPDRLETIFERFYQEEGALRRTAGGTGLGLAICRQIIKRLGGKIWAESAGPDQGTQFHFTLPIAQAELPDFDGH
ncbi:MAG: GAF domain-containing protein [Synechococcales cyanobacterium CRU_2_2]|nr:GAF domain-containing protein [Synechococcales cyanobacterium CRU_2_2]